MNSKTCVQCGLTKDHIDFTKKASSPDGLSRYCRNCQASRRATRRGSGRTHRASAPVIMNPIASAVPLTAAADDFILATELISTWAAVQLLARRGVPAPNMLFVGPSGSGKTEAAKQLARLGQMDIVKVDAPAIVDPEAWFGTREVVVEDGAPKTVVVDSAFVSALTRKCVLLIDEVNRVSDATRQILLSLYDDSRAVTNPLTGQPVVRHPECYVIMTANIGLAFTGTYAMDPAFLTRSLTTHFRYLEAAEENKLVQSRTGCTPDVAAMFVRFANEARTRAASDEDFPPISTREVLKAAELTSVGLDVDTAAHQVIINSANDEGGAESVRAKLEYLWTGIRPK